ncbi:hypothetical protein [Acidithiobacillus caldus]|uniref:Uncharacterized protein n=1 Tax=Acidithiobacillus caldus (strain ATCC 51756 / DSM 8584 / KU) TaxID=637389 RepID=A0A059ZV03_ACICK|nr:hypothetical protein [Acidithiobacillus caldus]AIA55455.1 hypothetical protein Acaty_c1591 [Acidithiobacillus caldus ATCC 51756]
MGIPVPRYMGVGVEMGARAAMGMRMHTMVMLRFVAIPVLMGISEHIAR